MALYAIQGWYQAQVSQVTQVGIPPFQICDVGGAGSNFWQVLAGLTSEPVVVVDPTTTQQTLRGHLGGVGEVIKDSVEHFVTYAHHGQFDILTCISVIEHVEEVRKFFRACHMLLKPGGLLFLTTDYWDAEGDDTAHFHWMRKRIYNDERMRTLLGGLRELGYASLGQADWSYKGPQVYDYSIASAAMVKK